MNEYTEARIAKSKANFEIVKEAAKILGLEAKFMTATDDSFYCFEIVLDKGSLNVYFEDYGSNPKIVVSGNYKATPFHYNEASPTAKCGIKTGVDGIVKAVKRLIPLYEPYFEKSEKIHNANVEHEARADETKKLLLSVSGVQTSSIQADRLHVSEANMTVHGNRVTFSSFTVSADFALKILSALGHDKSPVT